MADTFLIITRHEGILNKTGLVFVLLLNYTTDEVSLSSESKITQYVHSQTDLPFPPSPRHEFPSAVIQFFDAILTSDGGLKCLVRLLRDFCMRPPPPESPTFFYGLTPPGTTFHMLMSKQSPGQGQLDQAAAYRFSLAFQCIV
jgi:hypothetical protein